ncbi:obscurin-like, partial [Astyanax mexicanus]|uniref:Obscurin, cytoskeletal calmodulin and titin-interacting RhoGEF n=2 Tax=Astyanax mexicanus TaxID=7994 RepID=A0A3B1IF10_ASTMX
CSETWREVQDEAGGKTDQVSYKLPRRGGFWEVYFLKNLEAQEGNSVSLHCELSRAGVRVDWWKGGEMLFTGERYQLRQRDATAELLIRKAQPEDSGVYRCVCGEQSTEATIKVNGRRLSSFPLRSSSSTHFTGRSRLHANVCQLLASITTVDVAQWLLA